MKGSAERHQRQNVLPRQTSPRSDSQAITEGLGGQLRADAKNSVSWGR